MDILVPDNNAVFSFRKLKKSDKEMLGGFFESLSKQTRSKFGPHPLTLEYAKSLICENIENDNVCRFVIASANAVIGYFMLDFNDYPDEKVRYSRYGIELDFSVDPVFAPCIHDDYQNQGIASSAMNALLQVLDKSKIKSIVLMGGTQEKNILARNFYRKFNFQELGKFYTKHNDLNNIDMRLLF